MGFLCGELIDAENFVETNELRQLGVSKQPSIFVTRLDKKNYLVLVILSGVFLCGSDNAWIIAVGITVNPKRKKFLEIKKITKKLKLLFKL